MNPNSLLQTDEDTWKTALSNSNKTLQSLDEDVKILQEWLKTQPHLPDLLDSNCLRNFLLLNKFSIEVAKQKLDNYYTLRKKFEEYCGRAHPKLPFNEEFCKHAYMVLYPKLTPELYRIFYFKIKKDTLPDSYEPLNAMKRILLQMQELRLRKDVMVGDLFLIDLKGTPMSMIPKFSPTFFLKTTALYEKVFSTKWKGMYFIHGPSFLPTCLAVMKRVIKPKLFERIHVLDDFEAIKKFLPLDCIPKDMEGTGPSLRILEETLNKFLEEERQLFDHLDEYVIDENLRPEKLENNDLLGVYGNFKKIDLD